MVNEIYACLNNELAFVFAATSDKYDELFNSFSKIFELTDSFKIKCQCISDNNESTCIWKVSDRENIIRFFIKSDNPDFVVKKMKEYISLLADPCDGYFNSNNYCRIYYGNNYPLNAYLIPSLK